MSIAVLAMAACDQVTIAEPDATWTGSIGRLVADGENAGALEFLRLDDAGPGQGNMTLVSVEGAPVDQAVRLETTGLPARMESLQARLVTTGRIDTAAVCWLRFEARALQPQVELGLARLSVIVRPMGSGVEPLLHRSMYLEPAWMSIDLTFAAPRGLDAGEAEIVFGVGTQLQVIDVGGVSMRCFDDDRPASLPETTFTYAGREPEAAWRATAERQIERYRKGDLSIEVTDADGAPVSDAEIHIKMSRHAFGFGASIDARTLAGLTADAADQGRTAAYRKTLKELFNTVTFEDDLRWTAWTDADERQVTEKALAWVRSLGLDLRGRDLVSANLSDLPEGLQQNRDQPDAIRRAVQDGVKATAGALNGDISAWDVVDRPRERSELLDLLGWDELGPWFQLARSAAPDAKLVLNESDILAGDRMAELATLLGNLLGEDVPIDRIGVQGQFSTQPPPIQVLGDRLDQLASFDLPLVVTAFDMATSDEELQRDFTKDFLTLAFSHPSVEGFVFGQFWEDSEEPSGSAIFRRDGAISPIGRMYRDLVLRSWWTDVVALSNADGELISRVFQGDYMISARKDDQSATATLRLGPEGARVTLKLAAKDDADQAL